MTKKEMNTEKLLFLYSCALEDGDFANIETILQQAENNPEFMAQLQEIDAVYAADLQFSRGKSINFSVPTTQTSQFLNGHALVTPMPDKQSKSMHSTNRRGFKFMRIAILIITMLGSFFTYLGTYHNDDAIIVTEIPTGQSATLLPQTERVPITAENVDQLTVLQSYGEIHRDADVAWSHDGQQIIVYGTIGLRLYDAHTYELVETIDLDQPSFGFAVNPQKSEVAFSSGRSEITFFDLVSQEVILTLETTYDWPYGLTYSPNGKMLAMIYGEQDEVHIFDTATGELKMVLHGYGSEFRQLVFSPDNQYLAVAGTLANIAPVSVDAESLTNQGAVVWDITLGLPVASLHAPLNSNASLIYSADGQSIFITDLHGEIYMWDTSEFSVDDFQSYNTIANTVHTGNLFDETKSESWKSSTSFWLNTEDTLMTVNNEIYPEYELWDLSTEEPAETIKFDGLDSEDQETYATYKLNPDNTQLLRIISGKIQVIDLASNSLVGTIPFSQDFWSDLTFDAASSRLVVNGRNGIILWDVITGQEINRTVSYSLTSSGITDLQFSKLDPNLLMVTGGFAGRRGITAWNIANNDIEYVWQDQLNYERTLSIDIAEPNRLLFTTEAGELSWYEINEDDSNQRNILTYDLFVRPVYFSDDPEALWTNEGHVIVKDYRKIMYVYDRESGDIIAELTGHVDNISNISLSEDGNLLASVDYAGTLIIWDTATWEPLHKVFNVAEGAYQVSIANDNRLVAIGGGGQIVLWDMTTESMLVTLEDTGSVVKFSPDGTLLATFKDNEVVVWGIPE